jgi:N-acetylglucosamine-6-sulfatase
VVPTPRASADPFNIPRLQPNLLFVLTDDQRLDQMIVMPRTIKNFNVEFTNAFVATPLCCPARATFLTGEYPHNTGVWTNYDYPKFQAREADSLGPWLKSRGYFTGFVGRYLNKYKVTDPLPPGWDEFYGRMHHENGRLIGDGYSEAAFLEHFKEGLGSLTRIVRYPNRERKSFYATDYFAEKAIDFLDHAESLSYNSLNRPWALVIWPNAPHLPLIPAERHRDAPVPPFRPAPSFMERDMWDKPTEARGDTYQNLNAGFHRKAHASMLRMMMSVDELVGRVWSRIDDYGQRDDTWGLYASDNGWFLGEHRKMEKVYAYEEAAHVPLRMAVPGAGRMTIDELISNVDVAPTFMDLAGDSSSHHFRGTSLLPLIDGTATGWRNSVLIEARSALRYDAVRTAQWKLIRWESGNLELYDLAADPYELRNVAGAYPSVVASLQQELDRLKAE